MKFQNIAEKVKNFKFFSTKDTSKLPNVKKLLLERYLFVMNKQTYSILKENDYEPELHTKYESSIGVYEYDSGKDGEEKIYTESWDLLSRRVARRIAVGILGLIDKKNSEYITQTSYIKKLKKDNDFLLTQIRNMESDFYYLLKEKIFIPSSPFLFNAGRSLMDSNEQLYLYLDEIELNAYKKIYNQGDPGYGSCYSMGTIKDDIKGIYDMLYNQAEIFRHAGGFGANFSNLRSKHAIVSTIKGNSSGPLSFMKPFNGNTELIAYLLH